MTNPMQSESMPTRPLAIAAILGALFFAWIAWRVANGTVGPSDAALECKDRYARASSFADTARVDGTYPVDYAKETQGRREPATCGYLRREQLLP